MAPLHPVQLGYVIVFSLAAVGCFLATYRARRIEHQDTRWGLITFLAFVGLWAVFEASRIAVPTTEAKVAFYLLGLVVGLAAGGSWLYFTSAYAGHEYHRNPAYRWAAVVTFVVLVAVKLTNPIHHLYFSTEVVATPFPHLVIEQGMPHWIIAAFLYLIAVVGFYMLFQLFVDSHVSTTSLGFVVMLAGVPAILDLLGHWGVAGLLELNYEPLGVAAFGIGALYFVEESFMAVQGFGRQQIIDRLTEAVVLTDTDGRIQDANDRAQALFPDLEGAMGHELATALPQLASIHRGGSEPVDRDADGPAGAPDDEIVRLDHDGHVRYYLARTAPLTIGPHRIGQAITLADVTELERQRTELRRQNDQLDGFAAAIAHELRNGIAIVSGNVDLAARAIATDDSDRATEAMTVAQQNSERMIRVVDDLTKLARYSQTVEDCSRRDFRSLVGEALGQADTGELSCAVEGDGEIVANVERFGELVRNAVVFARLNGATALTVGMTADGFTVSIHGVTLAVSDPAALFEYGTAIPNAKTGMLAANLQVLARAHGWRIAAEIDEETVRFVVSGVSVTPLDSNGGP